eukprot:symbB.v1.2.021888.t1/scaffold1916.1/size96221/3
MHAEFPEKERRAPAKVPAGSRSKEAIRKPSCSRSERRRRRRSPRNHKEEEVRHAADRIKYRDPHRHVKPLEGTRIDEAEVACRSYEFGISWLFLRKHLEELLHLDIRASRAVKESTIFNVLEGLYANGISQAILEHLSMSSSCQVGRASLRLLLCMVRPCEASWIEEDILVAYGLSDDQVDWEANNKGMGAFLGICQPAPASKASFRSGWPTHMLVHMLVERFRESDQAEVWGFAMAHDEPAMTSPMIAKLEEEVLELLLAREDVKRSMELAQEGQVEEATSSLLAILQDILAGSTIGATRATDLDATPPGEPQPDMADVTPKRPCSESAEVEVKRPRMADEYWLEECSRAAEADRLQVEERSRAKALVRRDSEVIDVEAPTSTGSFGSCRMDKPLFWRVDLPEVLKVLSKRGVLPSNFLPVVKPHVTLLYLGGDLTDESAAKRANLNLREFQHAKEALERLKGRTVAVKMTEIIIEENVACALVELPKGIPCGSKIPHLTLGTRENVPARHANDVLEEINQGRSEGITRIKLPKPKELRGILGLETSATYAGKM